MPPRSRQMGGCANCRSRHVKCDQAKPYCLTCSRHGRQCGGYKKSIIFHSDVGQEPGKVRCHLFSEGEQRRTSEALLAHVTSEGANKFFQDIETLSESAATDDQIGGQVRRGPFGAFRLTKQTQTQSDDVFPVSQLSDSNNVDKLTDFDILPDFELQNQHHGSIFDQPDLQPDGFFAAPFLVANPHTNNTFTCWPGHENEDNYCHNDVPRDDFNISPMHSFVQSSTCQQDIIPQEAPFLLKHYLESVITSLTPVQDDKSPWHVIFFAHAKDVLATMVLARTPDHAGLSIFYSVLAISAFSCRTSSTSQRWHQIANQYRLRAQAHLQRAWSDGFCIPKKVKYKAVLTGLLAMIQSHAFAGALDEAENHLVDSEKFIRLYGLTKPSKSRRVRILHHCYSFPRIFYESTFVLDPESSRRDGVLCAGVDLSALSPEQDSPVFKLGNEWSELNETMFKIKSKESGETDLHLERPGLWNASLYPDIFGIPESLMVLLSQVIRLGNERDAAERNNTNIRLKWKDFWSRARSLESCVLQWRHHTLKDRLSWDPRLGIETASADRQALVRNMLEALCEALSIYFYRRVHNLHPSFAQDKVRAVGDILLRCDQIGDELHHTAGFSWSAFIAACEATDPALQASFSIWFKARIEIVGWPCFATMFDVIQKVWRQNQAGQEWISWPKVLRAENTRFFYM